jgi:two-component system sensor histidine kinase SenX3
VLALWFVLGAVLGAVVAVLVARVRSARVGPAVVPQPAAVDVEPPLPLREALDALSVGVVLADRSGRVLFRNRMAAGLTGARHADVLVDEAVERHLGAAVNGETRRQVLDLYGPPRKVVAVQARPLDDRGAVATIEDITERSRVDAVRTDFVANISHELKTPIGALAVLAEALEAEDEVEVIQRLAAKMVNEAHRVGRTIDDLLELSRIELGGEAVREVVSCRLVLADAAERVRPLAEQRGIRVDVIEPPEPLKAVGDRRQLVSAVGNLIENAVKYSERGTAVTVSAQRAVAVDGAHWVDLCVEDRGIGIPQRDLDRIFERFYRVDRARSRETGGTGLGLAIVRHVATNHGGEVKVTSIEGEGSTFTLRIPASGAVALDVAEAG